VVQFNEVIEKAIESYVSRNINTAFMGKVESIEGSSVSIKPMLKKTIDDEVLSIPIIEDVELLELSSSDGENRLEIKSGDFVLCFALQRDHTDFFETLKEDIPPTKRMFDLADIVALPFGFSSAGALSDAAKGWSAKSKASIKLNLNDTCFFEMEENKVKLVCDGVNVLDVISQTLEALEGATVPTISGPQPLSNASVFTELKTKIDKIKGE
jgi:hypothetical protein